MRKVKFITIVLGAAGMLLGLSSCKKCVTCTSTYNSIATEEKVCKAKGASKDEFDAVIRNIEDGNTVCK